jgi:hypothetical protein
LRGRRCEPTAVARYRLSWYGPMRRRVWAATLLLGRRIADAQQFLDAPSQGRENSEGEVGVYRYREMKMDGTDLFALGGPSAGHWVRCACEQIEAQGPGWSTQP